MKNTHLTLEDRKQIKEGLEKDMVTLPPYLLNIK